MVRKKLHVWPALFTGKKRERLLGSQFLRFMRGFAHEGC